MWEDEGKVKLTKLKLNNGLHTVLQSPGWRSREGDPV